MYEVRDIHRDPGAREEVKRILGQVRVPLLEIRGRYVSGFSRREMDRLLGRT